MKYKPETIPIPQDKPYEYDQLKRQECGNSLKNLIINAGGPLVVSLNGGWGTGGGQKSEVRSQRSEVRS